MQEVGYWLIMNYINILLGSYLPAMFFLVPRRGKKIVNGAVFSSLYIVWIILSHYAMKFSMVIYPFIGNLCVIGILLAILYKDNWKRKLIIILYLFFTGIMGDFAGLLYLQFLIPEYAEIYFKAQMPEAAIMTYLMVNLCCETVTMVEAIAYFCLIRKKQKKLFAAFLLLPMYQFVLGTGFFMLCNDFTERVARTGLAIGIFCFAVDIMMLYFLENILQKQDVEAKIREQEKLRRQEYAYFEAAGRSAEELRMIRHDFSNHLQAMYKMSDGDGDRETVREMLEEMSRRIGRQEADGEYGRKGQGGLCRK